MQHACMPQLYKIATSIEDDEKQCALVKRHALSPWAGPVRFDSVHETNTGEGMDG